MNFRTLIPFGQEYAYVERFCFLFWMSKRKNQIQNMSQRCTICLYIEHFRFHIIDQQMGYHQVSVLKHLLSSWKLLFIIVFQSIREKKKKNKLLFVRSFPTAKIHIISIELIANYNNNNIGLNHSLNYYW